MFLPVWKLELVWTVGAIFSSTWLYPRAKHYQRNRSSLFQEKLKESGGLYKLFFYTSLPIFPLNSKKITLKEAKTGKHFWPQWIPNRSQLKIVFLYYYGNFEQDQAPLRDFLWQKRIPFKISRSTQSWWHWSPPMRLWIIDSNKNIFFSPVRIRKVTFLSNPSLPGKSPILLLRVLFWKRADLFLPLNGVFLGLENQTLSPFKSEASVNLKNSFWVVCIFKGFCAVWRSYSNFKKPILDKICSPLSARKLIQLGQAFTQINRNEKFRRNRLNYG